MPPSSTPVGYTDVSYAFNRLYTDRRFTDSAERDHPRFYRTAKRDGLAGEGLFYRIVYGDPQAVIDGEDNFSTGRDSISGVEGKQLSITSKVTYGFTKLGGRALRRAKGNKAAIYDLVTRHTNGTARQMGADLAFALQGDGNGIRGRIASGGISGNVITLENKWTVDLFKKNMIIRASSSSDGTSPRTGSTFVTKVLRKSKQIVVDDATDITSLTAGDYLFRQGAPGNLMQGFGVCTPLADISTSDSFRGINRSDDVEAFAGWRDDDTSKFPEEAIIDLAAFAHSHGAKFTEADVQAQAFANMVKRLGAKVMYAPGRTADVGFRYIEIEGGGQLIKVFSEPDMKDPQISRLFNPEDHEIRYTGGEGLIHTIRDDGGMAALRTLTADAIEIQHVTEHEYLQYDPRNFGVARHAE